MGIAIKWVVLTQVTTINQIGLRSGSYSGVMGLSVAERKKPHAGLIAWGF